MVDYQVQEMRDGCEQSELVAYKLANSAMVVMNLISFHENFSKYKKDYYKVVKILNYYFKQTIKQKRYLPLLNYFLWQQSLVLFFIK